MLLPVSTAHAAGEATRPDAAPAWAAPPKGAPATPPGMAARTPTIIVDHAVCRALPRHVPAPDVTYRPGMDAQGRPVVPADLPGGGADFLPGQIEIGITVPLAGKFGIPADALYAGEAYLGTVAVEQGRVTFNGRPIGDAAAEELVAVCARQGGN